MKQVLFILISCTLFNSIAVASWEANPVHDPMTDKQRYESGIVNRDDRNGIMHIFTISEVQNIATGFYTILMRHTPAELIHGKKLKIRVDENPVFDITGTNRLREEAPSSAVAVRIDFKPSCSLVQQLANGKNVTVQWNATATTKKHETFSLSGSGKALRKGAPSCFKSASNSQKSVKTKTSIPPSKKDELLTCATYFAGKSTYWNKVGLSIEADKMQRKTLQIFDELKSDAISSKMTQDQQNQVLSELRTSFNTYVEKLSNELNTDTSGADPIDVMNNLYRSKCRKYYD